MTDPAVVRARYDEFTERLNGLLHDFKDAIAPDWDVEEEHGCQHGEPCDCLPKEALLVSEFVVVVNWIDMDLNETIVTGYSAPHMRLSHTIGLIEYYRDRLRS